MVPPPFCTGYAGAFDEEAAMQDWAIVGIDLSKSVFHVCAADAKGRTNMSAS